MGGVNCDAIGREPPDQISGRSVCGYLGQRFEGHRVVDDNQVCLSINRLAGRDGSQCQTSLDFGNCILWTAQQQSRVVPGFAELQRRNGLHPIRNVRDRDHVRILT